MDRFDEAPARSVISGFIALLSLVASTVLCTLYVLQGYEVQRLEIDLDSSRASARAAWGKYYDLQEERDTRITEIENSCSLRVWELESKLQKCGAR